jgi:hypothetical protein
MPRDITNVYRPAWGNQHFPGHSIKVIKCIMKLMLGLFVDEEIAGWGEESKVGEPQSRLG